MLFLHGIQLAGLAAIAIPIAIHLFQRRRSRRVPWGAMIFLRDSLSNRHRNVLLEDMLLLVVRCLAVALAALAFARPFLPSGAGAAWALALPAGLLATVLLAATVALPPRSKGRRRLFSAALLLAAAAGLALLAEHRMSRRRFGGSAQRDIALVIDGSSSMHMERDGKTLFQQAIDDAHQIVRAAPRGTAFSLIVGGAIPSPDLPIPTSDRQQVLRALNDARPSFGTLRVPDALALAATTLAQGYHGAKQIVVIGDAQRIGWETADPESWAALRTAFERLPAKPSIVWRRLPLPATIRNAAVASITPSRTIVGTDRPVRIDIAIANTGTESITPQSLALIVDGKPTVHRAIGQIEPGTTRTLSFPVTPERHGAQLVEAVLDARDDLPDDDRAVRVLHVLDRLRVLVVDGGTDVSSLERPGTYTALALRPDAGTLARPDDPPAPAQPPDDAAQDEEAPGLLVDPVLLPANALATHGFFDDYAAIVLADVPRLPDAVASNLATYVEQGGGLLLFHGARADKEFFNAWSGPAGRVAPLPLAEFQSPLVQAATNALARAASQADAPAAVAAAVRAAKTTLPTLDFARGSHAALQRLPEGSDLDGAPLERWWTSGEPGALARVGARLSDGTPFLAEKRLGHGMVLQIPFSPEPSAGALVTRRSFVPFMHELVHYAARPATVDLNIPPACTATLRLGSASATPTLLRGLFGSFYPTHERKEPVARRIDPQVDFNWGGGSPAPGVPPDNFACHWTGSLRVPASGAFVLQADADDFVELRLDGKTLIHGRGQAQVNLKADQPYAIDVVHNEHGGGASVCLRWAAPALGIPNSVIPSSAFSPLAPDGSPLEFPASVQCPDGETLHGTCRFDGTGLALQVPGASRPGVYTVQTSAGIGDSLTGPDRPEFPFAILHDARESRLEPLAPAELDFVRRHVDLRVAESLDDVFTALRGGTFGRELWRPLAAFLFALLLAEPFLARWIATQRRTGERIDIEFGET
ncbi:MAG: BatA domain-containing protein [Kiritimatiellia bacterium]|jgi:hypothetical protein